VGADQVGVAPAGRGDDFAATAVLVGVGARVGVGSGDLLGRAVGFTAGALLTAAAWDGFDEWLGRCEGEVVVAVVVDGDAEGVGDCWTSRTGLAGTTTEARPVG
jgi:hypothetical protein